MLYSRLDRVSTNWVHVDDFSKVVHMAPYDAPNTKKISAIQGVGVCDGASQARALKYTIVHRREFMT
jgi:hypothetical protein